MMRQNNLDGWDQNVQQFWNKRIQRPYEEYERTTFAHICVMEGGQCLNYGMASQNEVQ
jgi:hypothetical protein